MPYADSLISQGLQGRLNDLPLVSKAKAPLSSNSLLFALLPKCKGKISHIHR